MRYSYKNTSWHKLTSKGWKEGISTSSHTLFYKGHFQCVVSHSNDSMTFSRNAKQPVDMMRGPVEKGIER